MTNTPIVNVQDRPFIQASIPAARGLTWSQMIANEICLLQDNNCMIAPFHLVSQAFIEYHLTWKICGDIGRMDVRTVMKYQYAKSSPNSIIP